MFLLSEALVIFFSLQVREISDYGITDQYFSNQHVFIYRLAWYGLNVIGFIAICLSTTQQTRKKFMFIKQLTTLKESYQNILNSFSQGILVSSQKHKVLYINQELLRFYEIDQEPESPLESDSKCIITMEDYLQKKLFQPYKVGELRVISKNESKNLNLIISEFQCTNIQKQYFLIDIDGVNKNNETTIFNKEPEVIEIELQKINFEQQDSVLVIIKNISQLLQSENEKNVNRYQQMLTATISHEIMNPLNSIINLSGIAEKSQTQEHKLQQNFGDFMTYFKIINTSSRLMHLMVKSQIDIQQIKQNCFMQKISKQIPSDQLMKVVELFGMQIEQKQLKLDVQVGFDQTVKYLGEWERYQQIIVNFLQNSVKFTTQGEISVHLSIETADIRQSVNIEQEKMNDQCSKCGYLVTRIIDSGIGMTEQTKQSLFQLFKSASVSEKGMIGSSGIGLGLSMSYDLLKMIHGVVNVESVHGNGTQVTFKINVKNEFCKLSHQFSGEDYKAKSQAIKIPIDGRVQSSNLKQQNSFLCQNTKSIKKQTTTILKLSHNTNKSKESFQTPFQIVTTPSGLFSRNRNMNDILTPKQGFLVTIQILKIYREAKSNQCFNNLKLPIVPLKKKR
eukprot:403364687